MSVIHYTMQSEVPPWNLTERQYQALQRVWLGESDKEIARHMGIGYRSVEQLVKYVLVKLNAKNRIVAAVMYERLKNGSNQEMK